MKNFGQNCHFSQFSLNFEPKNGKTSSHYTWPTRFPSLRMNRDFSLFDIFNFSLLVNFGLVETVGEMRENVTTFDGCFCRVFGTFLRNSQNCPLSTNRWNISHSRSSVRNSSWIIQRFLKILKFHKNHNFKNSKKLQN